MTDEKILSVLVMYEDLLVDALSLFDEDVEFLYEFRHIQGMIPKIRLFLNEGRRDKAFRWLGFIQGVFYTKKYYNLAELENHNKVDSEIV